jgi:hypothetical protein
MYNGKTFFSQAMDFLPWKTFHRMVDRYHGNHRVETLTCVEQFHAMAFAQLTYRESLHDIEASLSAQQSRLYHMGFRQPVSRTTLTDTDQRRDFEYTSTDLFGNHIRENRVYSSSYFNATQPESIHVL